MVRSKSGLRSRRMESPDLNMNILSQYEGERLGPLRSTIPKRFRFYSCTEKGRTALRHLVTILLG